MKKPLKSWPVKTLKNNDFISNVIKPAIDFIEKIRLGDRVSIVFGHDCDSISSAVIIYKLIKNLIKTKPNLIVSNLNSSIPETTLKEIKKSKPTHVIILDISYVNVAVLYEIRKFAKILIIDHHPPKGYTRISYCNPRIFKPNSYLPASYLCYKIYEKFGDVKTILWIAGIGVLGDMGMKNCEDLFKKIKTVNRELVNELENNDKKLFEESLLGKLVSLVDSARIVKSIKGVKTAVDLLLKAKNFKEILNKKNVLIKYSKTVEKEFDKILKDFERNKKIKKMFVLYEIKSKLNLKSSLSNYLIPYYPQKILLIYQKMGEKFFEVSLRKGKDIEIDLGKLIEEIVSDIPNASGGGHPSAAGARIPVKFFRKFMRKIDVYSNKKDLFQLFAAK